MLLLLLLLLHNKAERARVFFFRHSNKHADFYNVG